ncbi:hypothetical protein [Chryseobacterium taichungense]|uniref:hypothetical protein n=1 Tax=Chryseobacterium taichungense TaxID=295069 RepID=UPI0028B22F46|nr:hypothetical protein [Chryseobacterium taichungense]
MKHLFTTAAVLFSMTAFAQVGINNTSPKATLDITAKTSGTKPEGLIIPQLAGSDIHTATAAAVYGAAQKGLIVYASSADTNPTGPTANITAAGYYYFDGTNWQKISTGNTVSTSLASVNIYVGSASNVATAVSPTGDVTISNTGATSIGSGKVTTAHLANNAVTVAKLPTGATATTFLRGDGTWVTPTDTNTTYTAGTGLTLTGTSFSANDATTGTKGIIQLAGDLAGPVAAPTIAIGAVTSAKIADGTVANADLDTGVGGIYKGSGALSGGNTSVDLGTNTLAFTSGATNGTSHFTVDGTTLNVDAVNNRVGIGTNAPAITLDVSGDPTSTSKLDGVMAPRITGQQLRAKTYTSAQTGALIYVTLADPAPSGQTVNVSSSGYYYFTGTVWEKLVTTNVTAPVTPKLVFSAKRSSDFTGTVGVVNKIPWNSETYDVENAFTLGSTTYQVQKAGIHQIFVNATVEGASFTVGSAWYLRILKNNGVVAAIDATRAAGASAVVFAIENCNVGDTISADFGLTPNIAVAGLTKISIFRFE